LGGQHLPGQGGFAHLARARQKYHLLGKVITDGWLQIPTYFHVPIVQQSK
jgi:hypothetical protein